VLNGVQYARERGGRVISMTGFDGGKLPSLSEANVHVPFSEFGLVEDMHLLIGHIIMTSMKIFIKTY
jgi:D-sedoheptulose 7-phosphate isomerase